MQALGWVNRNNGGSTGIGEYKHRNGQTEVSEWRHGDKEDSEERIEREAVAE